MGDLAVVALVVAMAAIAFVVSIRVGILLGLRMDRALEERAGRESGPGGEVGGDD